MPHSIAPATLLSDHLQLLLALPMSNGVLDLACGTGRNGIFLASYKIPVVFADINAVALQDVQVRLQSEGLMGNCWHVDLEQSGINVLEGKRFDSILVFNYLHRALLPAIKAAIRPGGLVFYETFTVLQRQFGRPSNPDFLLLPDELGLCFNSWEVLHYHEGELQKPDRAVAQLIARKPM